MRGDGVGELGEIGDRLHDADDLGRDLLVELHIALEVGHDRARQCLRLDRFRIGVGERNRGRFVVLAAIGVFLHARTLEPFDQHLHGAVGKLQELKHAGERTGLVNGIGRRIIVGRVLLRREHDQRVVLHHLFERADRLLATDEERNDHVREDDDVAQRQHGIGVRFAMDDGWPGFWISHGLFLLLCPLARSPPCSCATATRCRGDPQNRPTILRLDRACRIGTEANLEENFRSPSTLGGYRPGGCQVIERRAPSGAYARV